MCVVFEAGEQLVLAPQVPRIPEETLLTWQHS